MTQALTLTQLTAFAPQSRRPGESVGEWTTFLQWVFHGHPRPPVPPALEPTCLLHQWHRRAAVLDARLRSDPETPDQAVRKIAEHALIILRAEIEHAAVRALERPGQARLGDLVALMKLMHDMGATARAQTAEDYDFTQLTLEEMKVLTDAAAIQLRCAVRKRTAS